VHDNDVYIQMMIKLPMTKSITFQQYVVAIFALPLPPFPPRPHQFKDPGFANRYIFCSLQLTD